MNARICIVTPGSLSSNPRVVKEADALAAAGYRVRVVFTQDMEQHVAFDVGVTQNRDWQAVPIRWTKSGWGPRLLRYRTGLRQALFRRLAQSGWRREPVAELANARLYRELLRAACREPADLIIAHYVPALSAAYRAAKRLRVPFAFDAEDDHFGEFTAEEKDSLTARLVDHLQAKYLPQCVYISTASEGIADALVERYGVASASPVHNVFAWADRKELDGAVNDRRGPGLSLIWFSQVIGLNRGLQDVIRAAGLVRGNLQVHLRGNLYPEVKSALDELARESSVAGRVYYHPPVPPSELLSRTAEHDIGMAVEQPVSRNRLQTCTNKVFFYMLAGVAIAATDTPGQRRILESAPEACCLYRPGDYRALADHLQRYLDDPAALHRAKAAALDAARDRWNWERESERLLELVADALARRQRGSRNVATLPVT